MHIREFNSHESQWVKNRHFRLETNRFFIATKIPVEFSTVFSLCDFQVDIVLLSAETPRTKLSRITRDG